MPPRLFGPYECNNRTRKLGERARIRMCKIASAASYPATTIPVITGLHYQLDIHIRNVEPLSIKKVPPENILQAWNLFKHRRIALSFQDREDIFILHNLKGQGNHTSGVVCAFMWMEANEYLSRLFLPPLRFNSNYTPGRSHYYM